jgi:hypothetical protein
MTKPASNEDFGGKMMDLQTSSYVNIRTRNKNTPVGQELRQKIHRCISISSLRVAQIPEVLYLLSELSNEAAVHLEFSTDHNETRVFEVQGMSSSLKTICFSFFIEETSKHGPNSRFSDSS